MACSTVDGPGWQLGRRNEARASDVREGSRHRAWMEHPTPKGNRCTRDGDGYGDAIFGIASPSGPRRDHLQYNTHGIQDDCLLSSTWILGECQDGHTMRSVARRPRPGWLHIAFADLPMRDAHKLSGRLVRVHKVVGVGAILVLRKTADRGWGLRLAIGKSPSTHMFDMSLVGVLTARVCGCAGAPRLGACVSSKGLPTGRYCCCTISARPAFRPVLTCKAFFPRSRSLTRSPGSRLDWIYLHLIRFIIVESNRQDGPSHWSRWHDRDGPYPGRSHECAFRPAQRRGARERLPRR